MQISIRNMVITVVGFSDRVDLGLLARKIDGAEYAPEQFPGLVYKLKKPRASFLIFSTGKMNCVGATSMKEAENAIDEMLKILKGVGVKISKPKIEVQNIVAAAKLDANLNLNTIASKMENSEYEPEQFPGLVYRMKDLKVVFLLFGSGRIVCVGARHIEQVKKAVNILIKKLKKIGAFRQI